MNAGPYPHVRVEGMPRERGRAYGEQAAARVRASVLAYERVFEYYAGWEWQRVRDAAIAYVPAIAAYDERYLHEILGIAEGAALDFEDVLAINVRTEVMFSAKVREREGGAHARTLPLECTALAALPEVTAGHTLLAQNWDWLVHAGDTLVVLESRQTEAPDFVTVVEAGLLSKCGFNSAGVGVVTNALVSDSDRGEPAVPYHVVLRSLLDSDSLVDARARLARARRSSSANYLIAESGAAFDVEAVPGDASSLFVTEAADGILAHTNHFAHAGFRGTDVGRELMPSSPERLRRMRDLAAEAGRPLTVDALQSAFADHAGHPVGVCTHPREEADPRDRDATLASVIMDLEVRTMWLADGNPCAVPYRRLDYAGFLSGE